MRKKKKKMTLYSIHPRTSAFLQEAPINDCDLDQSVISAHTFTYIMNIAILRNSNPQAYSALFLLGTTCHVPRAACSFIAKAEAAANIYQETVGQGKTYSGHGSTWQNKAIEFGVSQGKSLENCRLSRTDCLDFFLS